MPVIDYGPLREPLDLTYARTVVQAVMNWPRDAKTRQQFIATHISRMLADLETEWADILDLKNCDDREVVIAVNRKHDAMLADFAKLGQWFVDAGGHGAVAHAPGLAAFQNEMDHRFKDQIATGQILLLIRQMAKHHPDLPGGASVNKAVFILEQIDLPFGPNNRRDLRRAWAAYKPVAHFCAPLFERLMVATHRAETEQDIAVIMDKELEYDFLMFLADAEAYMEFGLNCRLQRAKAQPLLDPDKTWTLPEHRPWPESVRGLAPLGDTELRAASEYRAPRWDV